MGNEVSNLDLLIRSPANYLNLPSYIHISYRFYRFNMFYYRRAEETAVRVNARPTKELPKSWQELSR